MKIRHLILAAMAMFFSLAMSGCEQIGGSGKFVGKWHITKRWNQSIYNDLEWYVHDEDGIDLEFRSDHHLVAYQNGVIFPDWDTDENWWSYDAETNELTILSIQIYYLIRRETFPVESISKTHIILHEKVMGTNSVINEDLMELEKK